MSHTSYLEISRDSIKNNIDFVKSNLKDGVKLSFVVKGNAYGHGIPCIVKVAESLGIDHFSVFSSDEARQVFESAKKKPTIMIMGWIENDELEWAIKNKIEFFVFEYDRLVHAVAAAERVGKKARIHIELETGFNRTGFTKKELSSIIEILKNVHLDIIGICTHYAGAESIANYYRVKEQKKKFLSMIKWLEKEGVSSRIKHTACSAAMIRYPDTQMDMVRVGILLYGFWPSQETFIHYAGKKRTNLNPIKRAISWKSKVMSFKQVGVGEFVGYGTSFLTQSKTTIATVPVGYGYGYTRSLSNQGRALVNGVRVSVIGTVNMNILVLDVGEVENLQKGDEVVLIGEQGDLEISVASFGELSTQLNYELLTRIPADIPRSVID